MISGEGGEIEVVSAPVEQLRKLITPHQRTAGMAP